MDNNGILATPPPAPCGVRDLTVEKIPGLAVLAPPNLTVRPEADKISLDELSLISRDLCAGVDVVMLEAALAVVGIAVVDDSLLEIRNDGHDCEFGGCWDDDVGVVAAEDDEPPPPPPPPCEEDPVFLPIPLEELAAPPAILLLRLMMPLPPFPIDEPFKDSLFLISVRVPSSVGVVALEEGPVPVGVGMSEQEFCAWLTKRRAHLQGKN